ncbi:MULTISPECIES: DUF3905 domain-containing protein [Paenibacillus]|uniref:Uncharacterized protein n=1 Tax=Paenibacillus naphthalenovorans TaxID=162209 RepID=A0A0U2M7R0_9BACL|nr:MULTISPECIES: DUF3905 domain-containing protein [Paenibacillus]ALS24240.1 hypothetical protein IJ22_39280 [Paenibacillus naphthalenovorans]NTZ20342.1 DUF3905 domain-containing protein [Paenibacillus sp. JMULE4]GCL73869.1 DUF3905 domain-containing protein [Paenibacillus naphthalenovorans]SDI50957.1 Protein of unknown function [Paenibacillus naphthalenovorans]
MSDKPEDTKDATYDHVKTDISYNRKNDSELDPFEINFRKGLDRNRGPREPFVNEHGVLIGDHEYQSEHSPLEQWTENTDPAIMSGDGWVHPYKDIGFHTTENKELFEKGNIPQGAPFMHPDKDAAYPAFQSGAEEKDDQAE